MKVVLRWRSAQKKISQTGVWEKRQSIRSAVGHGEEGAGEEADSQVSGLNNPGDGGAASIMTGQIRGDRLAGAGGGEMGGVDQEFTLGPGALEVPVKPPACS